MTEEQLKTILQLFFLYSLNSYQSLIIKMALNYLVAKLFTQKHIKMTLSNFI